MKKRTQIEAELAQLALEIGGKSHSEAAKAVLDLYKGLALLKPKKPLYNNLPLRSRICNLNFVRRLQNFNLKSVFLKSMYLHLPLRRLQQCSCDDFRF